MKQELQEELFNIAPEWFNRGDIRQSLMAFGFEVGEGWFGILKYGMTRIKDFVDDSFTYPEGYPQKFQVEQVKEKFGTLRFYVSGADDHVNDIITAMEMASHVICEFCGASGEYRGDLPWKHTLCDKCHEEYKAGRRVYHDDWYSKGPTTQEEQGLQARTEGEG